MMEPTMIQQIQIMWKNFKSIGIVEKTIKKNDKEIRYYINCLATEIALFENNKLCVIL